jgi:hypothetical protein
MISPKNLMKNKMLFRSFFILLALVICPSLHADDFFAVKERVIADSSFKLGFLYFTPLFMLENVGYTSSIFTYENKETPDWTGDIGLGLRASAIAANRLILQVEDLPYYSFYLENKNLRSWSNRFSTTAYSYFGPFNLKAGHTRNNLRQRPQMEFSRPFRYADSEWTGEADIGRNSNLFLTVYGIFRKMAYDESAYLENYNLAESLNHRENVYGLKLNQRIFTSTIVYANYERSDYRFELRPERDARDQTIAAGVEFPEIGALQGNFQIGLKRFEPENPLFLSVQRANGRGEVQLSLMDRLHLRIFYELQTYFSYGSSDLFYDNQSFGGGAEVYLTRFLKVGNSYQDGRLKYYSFRDLLLRRSDRLRNQRYYLAIPFFGNTSLGFAYNIYRLTSDALGLDYTRNFWGGFINYEF